MLFKICFLINIWTNLILENKRKKLQQGQKHKEGRAKRLTLTRWSSPATKLKALRFQQKIETTHTAPQTQQTLLCFQLTTLTQPIQYQNVPLTFTIVAPPWNHPTSSISSPRTFYTPSSTTSATTLLPQSSSPKPASPSTRSSQRIAPLSGRVALTSSPEPLCATLPSCTSTSRYVPVSTISPSRPSLSLGGLPCDPLTSPGASSSRTWDSPLSLSTARAWWRLTCPTGPTSLTWRPRQSPRLWTWRGCVWEGVRE